MTSFQGILLLSFVGCELLSLATLQVGGRAAKRLPWLRTLGERSHDRKLRALDSVWPLTRLRRAIARRDLVAATGILTPLILSKSAVALPLGLIVLPWLPFAGLLVPAIVMAHGPVGDESVRRWAMRVARCQVTSHASAAAVGFSLALHGPLMGGSAAELAASHSLPIAVLLAVSVASGTAAGWFEARGVVLRGYLDAEAAKHPRFDEQT